MQADPADNVQPWRMWNWLTSPKTPPEQDHVTTPTLRTALSSTPPDDATNRPVDAHEDELRQPSSASASEVDRDSSKASPSQCALPQPGMNANIEALDTVGASTPNPAHQEPSLPADTVSSHHDNDFDFDSKNQANEKDPIEAHGTTLLELSDDRSTVMGLRSSAQEQARALRRLYNDFSNAASSIVVDLIDTAQVQSGPTPTNISNKIEEISTLLNRIEVSRKAFDRSQERLSTIEWKMNEKEKRIYTGYLGISMPTPSIDGTSENPSDLSSLPLSPSSENERHTTELSDQASSLERDSLSEVFQLDALDQSQTVRSAGEIIVPGSTALGGRRKRNTRALFTNVSSYKATNLSSPRRRPVSLPVSVNADQKAITLNNPGSSLRYLITKQAGERLRRYARQHNPEVSRAVGAQFLDVPADADGTNSFIDQLALPAPQYAQRSDTSLLGFSRWLSQGVPWNSQTPRHDYRLPQETVDTNLINDFIVQSCEQASRNPSAYAKMTSMSNQGRHTLAMGRTSLVQTWLWEPNTVTTGVPHLPSIERDDDVSMFTERLTKSTQQSPKEALSVMTTSVPVEKSVKTTLLGSEEQPDTKDPVSLNSTLDMLIADARVATHQSSNSDDKELPL